MAAKYSKNMHLFYAAGFVVILAGCAQQEVVKKEICPPSKNLHQIMEQLAIRSERARPIRTNGNMKYTSFVDGKKEPEERLDIRLRFYPPDRLYLRANSILGEELCLGVNARDFWLRIKTNPPNAYWFGRRDDMAGCSSSLFLGPESLLEAVGIIDITGNWQLDADNGMDVLVKIDDGCRAVKKIHIDRCTDLPKKTEYLGQQGQIVLAIEMAGFTTGKDGIVVPAEISITGFENEQISSIIDITLTNIKLFKPTQALLEGKLFKLPRADSVKNVFELDKNCQFIRK